MHHTGPDEAGLVLTKCSELWMNCFSELNLTGSGVLRGATTLVLTWMTRGKDNKEIKRGGSRVWERLHDRQSIIRVKMLTPHCTFTFHQVFAAAHGPKECTGGRPVTHLTPGFPFSHRFFLCPSLGQTRASTRPPQSSVVCALASATWIPLCLLNREQRTLFHLCRRKSAQNEYLTVKDDAETGFTSGPVTGVTEVNGSAGHVQAWQTVLHSSVHQGPLQLCGCRLHEQRECESLVYSRVRRHGYKLLQETLIVPKTLSLNPMWFKVIPSSADQSSWAKYKPKHFVSFKNVAFSQTVCLSYFL